MKVLYVGDSETVVSRYRVGADVFEQSYFNDMGARRVHLVRLQPDHAEGGASGGAVSG
jgi:hypothetical protein